MQLYKNKVLERTKNNKGHFNQMKCPLLKEAAKDLSHFIGYHINRKGAVDFGDADFPQH